MANINNNTANNETQAAETNVDKLKKEAQEQIDNNNKPPVRPNAGNASVKASGTPGLNIATLGSASNQNSSSTSVKSGASNSQTSESGTREKAFDKSKLDPQTISYLNNIANNKDGNPLAEMVNSYKEPSPEDKEKAEKLAKKKKTAANVANALQKIIHMGGYFAGGNYYQTDDFKDIKDKADQKADEERKRYDEAVEKYKQQKLDVAKNAEEFRQRLLGEAVTNAYSEKSEANSTQETNTAESTQGTTNTETKGVHKQIVNDPTFDAKKQAMLASISNAGDKDMVDLASVKFIKGKDGKVTRQYTNPRKISKTNLKHHSPKVINELIADVASLKYVSEQTGLDKEQLRQLANGGSVKNKNGEEYTTEAIASQYFWLNTAAETAMFPRRAATEQTGNGKPLTDYNEGGNGEQGGMVTGGGTGNGDGKPKSAFDNITAEEQKKPEGTE